MFVLCEVLFEFGYKADMQKRIKAKVLLNLQEHQAAPKRNVTQKGD